MAKRSRLSEPALFIFIALLAVCLRLAALSYYPIPVPMIHDEFATILGAETFAMGRLTNPPPPFADAFLEFHTLSEPTRMMKYQPAMALFMAGGITLLGDAYWGVVACMALALATGYWALRGWLGQRAAFAAAIALVLLFRTPHYWMQSYWGGAPILLASFMMLGAYGRVFNRQQFGYVAVGLLGVVLAFLSRPFEGGALALCLAACAAHRTLSFGRQEQMALLKSSALPVLLILPAYAAFQLIYNHAVTGDWLTLPYLAYDRQHTVASILIGKGMNMANLSTHYAMRALQEWEIGMSQLKRQASGILYLFTLSELLQMDRLSGMIAVIGEFTALVFFFIYVPIQMAWQDYRLRDRSRIALHVSWAALFIPYTMASGASPHYLAPQCAVAFILITLWWEGLARQHLRRGGALLAITYLFFAAFDGEVFAVGNTPSTLRAQATSMLLAEDGDDLIFVDQRKEASEYNISTGWVYNAPDIEPASIIWAWYVSPDENKKLTRRYPHRKIWYIAPHANALPTPYTD